MREVLTGAEKRTECAAMLRALLELLELDSSCVDQSICIQPGFINCYDQERGHSWQESPPRDIPLNEVLVYCKRRCYDAASNVRRKMLDNGQEEYWNFSHADTVSRDVTPRTPCECRPEQFITSRMRSP